MSAEPEVRSMKEVAKIAIHLDVKSLASLHINLMNDPDFIDFVVGKYGCQLAEKGYEIEHHTLWLRIGSHPDYSFQNIPDEYRNDYFFVRQLVDTRPELAEDADAKNVLEKHSYQNKFNKYKNQKESILPKILSENISKTPFYNESEEHHSKIFKEFSLSKKIVSAINISPIKQKLDLLNTQYKIG
jgi:alpha-galactosidase/6-phospho-beta-glucosidase family protein